MASVPMTVVWLLSIGFRYAIMSGLSNLSGTEASAALSHLKQPAENYVNDANIEMQWAMKAYHHAEVYFNLISSVEPTLLKITKIDDEIYKRFREEFSDLDVAVISEEVMKSADGKEKWRQFCNQFEKQVEDWNMGTLLRLDASKDISEENTTVVPRIQFLAVEIARNREGCNSDLRKKSKNTSAEKTAG